ncbi:MAG: precorrin-2 methylase [Candidatus Methanoliparum thermophilum]|uniref:Precorrin-2 methylase n=1 Tax=Methanoliparum thermophilum TaxID=2491083 RepID=A0A520KST1_METT2|nr:SAM-dependent methyltransferase [Candidatus Methanoliparum sp. LAM-1]RZN64458.1 MAG: precorrin-2 methylase [Candidatus Methanoliparum thermophilum]BDC35954.1 precorrin-2 C(20)-methyltransferase [Candidatus Methanoliparum sp. LAM-1]
MLIGVGLGPGDPELLTLKAIKVLKNSDEVIAPGRLAYNIISRYCDPRLVDIPMNNKADGVISSLTEEFCRRCKNEDIAFAAIGDIMVYSTFQHIVEKVKEINNSIKIQTIPGISISTSIFSKIGVFIDQPMLVTTEKKISEEYTGEKVIVVLKVKRPWDIINKFKRYGYNDFALVKRAYMDDEEILYNLDIPEESDYFTTLVGWM